MSILYWLFQVDSSLRMSLPSWSVHDEGFSRGWMFVLALMVLAGLWHWRREGLPGLNLWQSLAMTLLRWMFVLGLFFILVHPVLIMAGEEVPGLPEIEKVNLASSPWILALMLGALCGEWWLKRSWRIK